MSNIVEKSKKLMYQQTLKNKSPAWLLTELAVEKGRKLAKKYKVDEELVVVSLYLAHTVFDIEPHGKIQRNHTKLSAKFAKKHLKKWKVSKEKQDIIINAIEAHHAKVPTKSLEAKVMKNAECFKFVTLKGCLILLHEEGIRGISFKEAADYVIYKMNSKKKLLTFKDCKKEAEKNCKKIKEVFSGL